ncbi:MAG: (2Fe-2S)-binding protein [Rhodocyclaceae bacterium]|nr:(2Fe-2S)-binding protein [Rhodocyclaceae bacterium]
MYVCVCRAVTDRQVRQAVAQGARSLRDLRRQLGIIEECGRCAGCARQCLDSAAPPPTAALDMALQCRTAAISECA